MRDGRVPWLVALALCALALTVATLIRAYAAPAPASYFAQDQQVYLAIARAPFSDDPQVHHAAGCWRVLPPLLARVLGAPLGGPERGFLLLTFASFALLPLATLGWLEALGVSRTSAVACAGVMALAPPVIGLLAWDVVRVDPFALVLMFAAAAATVRGHGWLACVLVAAMALTKETALIGAGFALAWAVLVNRRLLPAGIACVVLAVGIRALLQRWIVPSSQYPFDNLHDFHVNMASLSASNVGRRLLLSTAGTWNVLVPLVVMAAVSRRWAGRELALSGAIAVAMAQLLFATDNERVVAAGYPFVMAWTAMMLDSLPEGRRRVVGVVIVAAQIPWLLEMGRIWPAPLPLGAVPHFPVIRVAEIGIVLVAAGAAVARLTRGAPRTLTPALGG